MQSPAIEHHLRRSPTERSHTTKTAFTHTNTQAPFPVPTPNESCKPKTTASNEVVNGAAKPVAERQQRPTQTQLQGHHPPDPVEANRKGSNVGRVNLSGHSLQSTWRKQNYHTGTQPRGPPSSGTTPRRSSTLLAPSGRERKAQRGDLANRKLRAGARIPFHNVCNVELAGLVLNVPSHPYNCSLYTGMQPDG